MDRKLKWLILGASRVSERLLPALVEAPNSQLVAVASRRAGAAKATLEKYAPNAQGVTCYDDLDALINDKNVEAIYSPAGLRFRRLLVSPARHQFSGQSISDSNWQ